MLYSRLLLLAYLWASSCFAMTTVKDRSLWRLDMFENNYVKYEIDPELPPSVNSLLNNAFLIYQNRTCLKFRKKQNDESFSGGELWFRKTDQTCRVSSLGNELESGDIRVGNIHRVHLNDHCLNANVILRLLSFALGFKYETNRGDRDDYMNTYPEYIIKEKLYEFNVDYNIDWQLIPFDYLSIMHYDNKANTDERGVDTLYTHDPSYQNLIGVGTRLSFMDYMGVNKVFTCDAKCPVRNPCNFIPFSFRGENCKCQCSILSRQLSDPQWMPSSAWDLRVKSSLQLHSVDAEVCYPPTKQQLYPDNEYISQAALYQGQICDDSWDTTYNEGRTQCFKVFEGLGLSWQDASKKCIREGGRLFTPRSKFDLLGASLNIDKYYWINIIYNETREAWMQQEFGLEIRSTGNIGDASEEPDQVIFWTDFKDPVESLDKTNCIALKGGDTRDQWEAIACDGKSDNKNVDFICQKNMSPCKNGWSWHNEHCYKVPPEGSVYETWHDGLDQCKKMKATIASSMSPSENKFLTHLLVPWNGWYGWLNAMKKPPYTIPLWLDSNIRVERSNTWMPFLREDWEHRYPEECLMLHREGWWLLKDCNAMIVTICKKPVHWGLGQHIVTTCKNEQVKLQCHGWGVIRIRSVTYGRQDSTTCHTGDDSKVKDCASVRYEETSYGPIVQACEGKKLCVVDPDDVFTGIPEPCPGVSKYLQTDYDCVQESIDNPDCPNLKAHPTLPFAYYMNEGDGWTLRYCDAGAYDTCGCTSGDGDQAAHASRQAVPAFSKWMMCFYATVVCLFVCLGFDYVPC